MLNMINGSIQNELNRLFQVLNESPIATDSVTTAAFCKARKKLSHTAFKALNDNLIDTFYDASEIKRWHNFRLLAVDGSVTRLPRSKELMSHYGVARRHSKFPAVRLSQLYDVKNQLSIDLQVDAHSTGERNQAIKHLEHMSENDLVLYDRGYPAVWFFKKHMERNVNFCVRAKLNYSNEVLAFANSSRKDQVIEFPCVEKSLRRCKKDGLPTNSIKLRLVKVKLPSGKKSVLITSLLDKSKYPHAVFSDLYHQRWGVEEDYKVMKCRTTIENYSGKSVEAILQDIYAKVLTKNITAVAITEADAMKEDKCKNRKLTYKINFTQAIGEIKDNIIRYITGTAPNDLGSQIIKKISTQLSACRPNRKYVRNKNLIKIEKYPMCYKRIC